MPHNHQRIYHFHVRKTAGTSLNAAFWALGGFREIDHARELARGVTGENGLRFVGTNRELIEAGDYFFAASHLPAWKITLPPETFTVTILRDPAARLISYYRYVLWVRAHADDPEALELEPFMKEMLEQGGFIDGGWGYTKSQLSLRALRHERRAIQAFGAVEYLARISSRRRESVFLDFLDRIPPRLLYAQLEMFSPRFDPGEAAEKVLACSAVCFTETFREDLARLSEKLDLDLSEKHERRFREPVQIGENEMGILREKMAPAYEMLRMVRQGLPKPA